MRDGNGGGRETVQPILAAFRHRVLPRPEEGAPIRVSCVQDRLPTWPLRIEITKDVPVPGDAEGRIVVEGALQALTGAIEGRVREYLTQGLLLHRRWR